MTAKVEEMLELLVFQGCVGDKSSGTVEGAVATGLALEQRYGIRRNSIGRFEMPVADDWASRLVHAKNTLTELAATVDEQLMRGHTLVAAIGTCSASLATLPVVAKHFPNVVILWVDAHGDFNTPATTGTGYLGGMVLSAACGLWDSGYGSGVRPKQVILVGARDIDAKEQALLDDSGVRTFQCKGTLPHAVVDAIGSAPVWIHIDWDVLEPGFVQADYSVVGGMEPVQLRWLINAIPREQIVGIELAEFRASPELKNKTEQLDVIMNIMEPFFAVKLDDKAGLPRAANPM